MGKQEEQIEQDLHIYIYITVACLFTFFAALFFFRNPYRSRAIANAVTIALRAQGVRKEGDRIKASVSFYNGPNKAFEDKNVTFINKGATFSADVAFGVGFNYGDRYAVFIKPEKHLGRVYCTADETGTACSVPQLIFYSAGSSLNLTNETFLTGDIPPMNGKVDAQDMSLIMKNLGQLGQPDVSPTDLNGDGITDVVDYSLALYSLTQNAADDAILLQAPLITTTPSPTLTVEPSAPPTPTFSLAPTDTPTPQPTNQPSSTPTPVPPTPTATPTPAPPTSTPTPTVKVPNYSKIAAMVNDYGEVGCPNGVIQGCPADKLYNTPMNKGLGWATHYGSEHGIVATVIKNRKGISLEAANQFVDDHYMQKQSNMTPEEAKKTGKVIAFGATRSPQDLWRIKYIFGIDDKSNPKPYFVGRYMVIDCAAGNDWNPRLATLTYGYKGWTNPPLNWIIDISSNGMVQIPTGYSGQQGNTGEGRPGVVVIDESVLDDMIY